MKISQTIIDRLSQEKIGVLGLAREGLSTYHFLRKILPEQKLTLIDQQPLKNFSQVIQQEFSHDPHLNLQLGAGSSINLSTLTLLFKTPGIPATMPTIQQALDQGTRLSSNLQLFLEIINEWQQLNQQKLIITIDGHSSTLLEPITIGVTGTKGKSTTSAVIHHVLQTNGCNTLFVGNIGQPALDKIDQIESNTKLVLELSAQQLAQLEVSPDIVVIQKVTSEHLDYYQNTQAYIDSKKPIAIYQKVNQYIIYDPQWPHTREIAQLSQAKKLTYDLLNKAKNDALVYIKDHKLIFRDINQEIVCETNELPLLGEHNLANVAPAIIVGKMLGFKTLAIAAALKNFQPLPHRLEKIAVKNNVIYINDSLATMPDAAISALSCFNDQIIILLAGGHERTQDLEPLAEKILASNVKAIALFPATGERLWQTIEEKNGQLKNKKNIAHQSANSMAEAMEFVTQHTQPGDVVLLSPGAASFGVFKNYQDRGEQFKQAVERL